MMPKALAECFCVLKPGGLLLFRDYGNGHAYEALNYRVFGLILIYISFVHYGGVLYLTSSCLGDESQAFMT